MYLDFIFELLFSRKDLKKDFLRMPKKEKNINLVFFILTIIIFTIINVLWIIEDSSGKNMGNYMVILFIVLFSLIAIWLFVNRKVKENRKNTK